MLEFLNFDLLNFIASLCLTDRDRSSMNLMLGDWGVKCAFGFGLSVLLQVALPSCTGSGAIDHTCILQLVGSLLFVAANTSIDSLSN